jgi:hypothetical protein
MVQVVEYSPEFNLQYQKKQKQKIYMHLLFLDGTRV